MKDSRERENLVARLGELKIPYSKINEIVLNTFSYRGKLLDLSSKYDSLIVDCKKNNFHNEKAIEYFDKNLKNFWYDLFF